MTKAFRKKLKDLRFNTIKVPMISIDSLANKYNAFPVAFIKIDVEGFEYEVLIGCKESMRQKKNKENHMRNSYRVFKNKGN